MSNAPERVSQCLLCYLDFQGAAVRVNSTPLTLLEEDSTEWLGVGSISEISDIELTADGGVYPFEIALNGIPATEMPELENLNYRDRAIMLYIANLNTDYRIAEKRLIIGGNMRHMIISGGKTNRVEIQCTAGIDWTGTSWRRDNNQCQLAEYPDDNGLYLPAAVSTLEIEV